MADFNVRYRLTIITSKPIKGATTFEEALEKGKKMKAADFITFKPGSDYCDGNEELIAIETADDWLP